MRKSRFTEAQIIGILKQAEGGATVADLAREHGVSTATIYNWRAKFGGMDVSPRYSPATVAAGPGDFRRVGKLSPRGTTRPAPSPGRGER